MSSPQPLPQQPPKTNPLDYKLGLKQKDAPTTPTKTTPAPAPVTPAPASTLQPPKPLARNLSTPNLYSSNTQIGPSPMDRDQGIRRGEGIGIISDRLNQAPRRSPSQAVLPPPAPLPVVVAPVIPKPQPVVPVQAQAPEIQYVQHKVVDDSVNKQARNMLAEAMAKVALLVMENNRLKYKEVNIHKELSALKSHGTLHHSLARSSSHQVLPPQPTHTVIQAPSRVYAPASTLTQSIHLAPHEVRTHQAPTTSYLQPQTYVHHTPQYVHQGPTYVHTQPTYQTNYQPTRTVQYETNQPSTIRRSGIANSSYSTLPLSSPRVISTGAPIRVSNAGPIRVSQTYNQSPVKSSASIVSRYDNYPRELY